MTAFCIVFLFEHVFKTETFFFVSPGDFFKLFRFMDLNGIDNLLMEKNAPGERSKKRLIRRN